MPYAKAPRKEETREARKAIRASIVAPVNQSIDSKSIAAAGAVVLGMFVYLLLVYGWVVTFVCR